MHAPGTSVSTPVLTLLLLVAFGLLLYWISPNLWLHWLAW